MAIRTPLGRRGFTFVELFVVVAILGLLTIILIVAASKARESAKRGECSNTLRQLGLAFHVYHDSYRVFPTENGTKNSVYFQLLPYVDEDTVQVAINNGGGNTQQPVKLYLCPSRRSVQHAPGKRDFGYALSPNNGSILDALNGVSALVISNHNGTANTLLFAHLWMDPTNYFTGKDPTDVGWYDANNNKRLIASMAKMDTDATGSTSHIGGPHSRHSPVLFADGHVDLLDYNFQQWAQAWNYLNTVEVIQVDP
jgi:prepilin-type processing-associated H-X9-DG protein/prepilin-type N-terminal cleavage/methylation domain-containing protein